MGYTDYLKDLLRPLCIYQLESSTNGAELAAIGLMLDGIGEDLETMEEESSLITAQSYGLDYIESLLSVTPVTSTVEERRASLAALLRIGGDSFTLTAINDTLKGCGLNVVATEGEESLTVAVTFPDVPGIPDRFDEMQVVIEEILPCHLNIQYIFWYITWAMMEERFATWNEIEALSLTWGELEKLVE